MSGLLFLTTQDFKLEPQEDGSNIEIQIDDNSERLQILNSFNEWDGNDYKDLKLLH